MKRQIRAALVLTACVSTLSLTACGGASTISSLTDSDSTTTTVGGNANQTTAVNAGTVTVAGTTSAASSTSSSLPAIPAQVVGNAATGATTSGTTAATSNAATAVTPAATATPAPTATPAADATSSAESFVPAGEGNTATAKATVNFRSEPDTSDEDNIIGGIKEGETVTVLDSQDGWYEVEYNGETGWVSSKYFE